MNATQNPFGIVNECTGDLLLNGAWRAVTGSISPETTVHQRKCRAQLRSNSGQFADNSEWIYKVLRNAIRALRSSADKSNPKGCPLTAYVFMP
jgi:hypothetical protein